MPKKIIYDYKTRWKLFFDQLKEEFPDKSDADIQTMLRAQLNNLSKLEEMFAEISRKYGEQGWHIHPIAFSSGDRWVYQFKKEIYTTKEEQIENFANRVNEWAKSNGTKSPTGTWISVKALKEFMDEIIGK